MLISAFVRDQSGRPIPMVNVDVHAEGPNDQLRFARMEDPDAPIFDLTDQYQAPDKNHVSKEATIECNNKDNDGEQGDHNMVGQNDRKHIESVEGTSDAGEFKFALYSGSGGGTFITAWADQNNDDQMGNSEASGGTSIGWGQNPPEPQTTVSLEPTNTTVAQGTCQRMEMVAREGGNALANKNVDVHITGPDSSVSFCPVTDGSATRAPDQGEHSSGSHTNGTKHIEGETDSFGRFIFGVLSPSTGSTSVEAWVDQVDDDTLSNEPTQSATIIWAPPGDRSITLDANKSSVRSGGTVKLFGTIDGDEACESGQTVKIKSRRPGRRFRGVGSTVTDDSGAYEIRVTVRRTVEFRAVSPAGGPCTLAKSNIVKVRAN
jgi:hypothetical protein